MLDTSVASLMFGRSPLLAPYTVHLAQAEPVISFQTVAEMRFGAAKASWGQPRRQQLESFLSQLTLIPYSDDLGNQWAAVMADAARAGRRLEAGDAWVAATARMLQAPLLTHDRDFDPMSCNGITVHRHIP